MVTSPRNRQANPLGPMGSSSGTGPLVSTWENQHSLLLPLPCPICQNHCRWIQVPQLWPARSPWSQAHKAKLSSHPDLIPIEVWHGFGIGRLLLTRWPVSKEGNNFSETVFSQVMLHIEMAAQEKVHRASD